jgi:hypothetical protein
MIFCYWGGWPRRQSYDIKVRSIVNVVFAGRSLPLGVKFAPRGEIKNRPREFGHSGGELWTLGGTFIHSFFTPRDQLHPHQGEIDQPYGWVEKKPASTSWKCSTLEINMGHWDLSFTPLKKFQNPSGWSWVWKISFLFTLGTNTFTDWELNRGALTLL